MQKCSSGFTFTSLQCCLFYPMSHRILLDPEGLARPLVTQEFQDPLLFYLKCCLTCCAGRQAQNLGSVQAGQKQVRGLLSYFCSLNKTSSILISLTTLHGEGNGTPLQYSCLENPMDGGAR